MLKTLITVVFSLVLLGGLSPSTRAGTSASLPRSGATASAQPPGAPAALLLSETEVSELQARAEEPGPEVTGGALSNEHLTYIVIALAAAVIVLIAK